MSCLGSIGGLKESTQFVWKIPCFFDLSPQKGNFYNSPSFVFKNTSMHLKLYPGGCQYASRGFLSLFLENETECPLHVAATLQMKKANGTLVKNLSFKFQIESDYGYRDFIARSTLEENKSELVPSGILTIICIFQHDLEGKQVITKAENSNQQIFIELDSLSENLRQLSTNKDSCDVILQVQGKEFKVHKLILMARSPVFAAMFQHDTLEKQTGTVNIPDCDSESFQKFLDFLYCGKFEDVSFHSVYHLYGTSNKYHVQKLKEFCVKYLIKSLTVDTVCDIIKLAEKYDDEELIKETLKFFYENWDQIFLTTEWGNLMRNNVSLAQKILVEMSKTKSAQ